MRYEKFIRDWKTALAENFFLRFLSLLLAAGFVMNASFFRKTERLVIVPPQVTREFWLEKDKASPEYLEQNGVFMATLAGNLSPNNADYNVKVLKSYFQNQRTGEVDSELSSTAAYIKKNNVTQAFFPASVDVDPEAKSVTVEGDAVRNIGTIKIAEERMLYRMRFSMNNYRLFLEELIVDYPERKAGTKSPGGEEGLQPGQAAVREKTAP